MLRPEQVSELIETLKAEHREILRQIENIQNAVPGSDPSGKALAELFHFVGTVHHQKEEEILFPALAKSDCLRQGGPLCGYFMGLRLDFDQLGQIRSRLVKFSKQSQINLPSHRGPSWLTPQNPLSIPMEEHEVAHLLSFVLIELLRPENRYLKEEFFGVFLGDYFNLIQAHIQKEESCLFIQCASYQAGSKIG